MHDVQTHTFLDNNCPSLLKVHKDKQNTCCKFGIWKKKIKIKIKIKKEWALSVK